MTDAKPSSLRVPEPAVRPGGTPSFADVLTSEAGAVRRPPVDAAADHIRDLASAIVRVLDGQGRAVGPWAGTLDDAAPQESHGFAEPIRRPGVDGGAR